MPDPFSSLASAGLGLAFGLAVLYVVLRGTAWRPGGGDPVRAVRVHAMVTALIALFASGTAGFHQLARLDEASTGGRPSGLPWSEALVTVSGPVLGLVLVYVVAQYTWPRQTGPVRTARLADRRVTHYLPPVLSALALGVALLAAGAVALAWTTPGVPSRWTEAGIRPGPEFAPWLALALVLVVLGVLVAVRVVGHRPPLGGLHPHDDHLVRHITVNRVLRTAVLMLWGVANAAVASWSQAHWTLAHRSPDALTGPGPGVPQVVEIVQPAAGLTGAVLMLAMLLWRSPALRRLGDHTVTGRIPARPESVPGRPGTVEAVRRLRRESVTGAWVAGTIAAVVTAGPLLDSEAEGHPVWAGLPFAIVLAVFGVYEFAVRRGHCPPARTSPSLSGTTPRWAWRALGVSLALAGAWCVLGLTTAVPPTGVVTALAVTSGVLAAGSIACSRLALRRPPLGRATAVEDDAVRSTGAERALAVGAAGITLVSALACFVSVQVWHGFTSDARLVLGVNELPDALLAVRLVVVLALACLAVLFLLGPSARAARDEAARPTELPVHR